MTDPADLAAFRAAVADAQPLPPDNRVQLEKPKPPARPRLPVTHSTPKPAQNADRAPWPERWQAKDSATPRPPPGTPDEAAFMLAMAGVQRLPEANLVEHRRTPPKPHPLQHLADEQAALRESLHGPISLQDRLEGGDEAFHLRPGMAQKVLHDLRRSRWVIQGETDLHGLNRDEARQQLACFLADSLHQGRRCIRVIHGKGLGSPHKVSVLRQLVRGWLAQREEVLAYCQAKPQDGGEGALIVLLRAPKKLRAV